MNREIKFRAWDGGRMATQPLSSVFAIHRFFGFLQEDEVIMQYTGLKDNNDKEIYERDIVRRDNDFRTYVTSVTFDGGFCPFHGDALSSVTVIPSPAIDFMPIRMPDMVCESWQVIGNIYENPELIEDNNARDKD